MGSVTTRLPSDVTLQGHFFPRDHFFSYGTRHAISPFRSGVHYIFQIFESRPISHLQNVINMFLLLFIPCVWVLRTIHFVFTNLKASSRTKFPERGKSSSSLDNFSNFPRSPDSPSAVTSCCCGELRRRRRKPERKLIRRD